MGPQLGRSRRLPCRIAMVWVTSVWTPKSLSSGHSLKRPISACTMLFSFAYSACSGSMSHQVSHLNCTFRNLHCTYLVTIAIVSQLPHTIRTTYPDPPWSVACPGDDSVQLTLCDIVYQPADEICRAFEYQLLNVRHCSDSALFWLFPLGLASKVLEDDLEYMRWIKGMLDTSKVVRGYGTGNNSYGFGSYTFPQVGKPRSRRGHKPVAAC